MRASSLRTAVVAALLAGAAVGFAQNSIQLQAFPFRTVADGRSTVTITAIVRDSTGRNVPDGTRVVFDTTLGNFREPVVVTANGIARAILVASNLAGVAQIKARTLESNSPPTVLDFEFVSDRSLLSSAQEFVEIVSPGVMQYTGDTKIVAASAPDQGVRIRYRDMTIAADDIQLDAIAYTLKARNARLRIGKMDQVFPELFLRIAQRSGYGFAPITTQTFDTIRVLPGGFALLHQRADGTFVESKPTERIGLVTITAGDFRPATTPVDRSVFEFADLSSSPSTIRAKKAVVFPRKGIQFQKAEVFVGPNRVLQMPLFELNLYATDSPIVTDQFVNVRDNSLSINYPHYMSIKPGQTTLFRLRTGENYGRTTAINRGVFLDYEWNWNRGDEAEGAFTFAGIGRTDWTAGLRHSWSIDPSANAFMQIQSPAGQSLFGSAGVSKQFAGFQVQANANLNRNLRGLSYTTQDYFVSVEKDATKVGKLPMRLFYGVSYNYSENTLIDRRFSNTGIYARLTSNPLTLDRATTATFSTMVRQITGSGSGRPQQIFASTTLTRRLSSAATLTGTYDYALDGTTDRSLGKHRISTTGSYFAGRTGLSVTASRSLDLDRATLYGDLSYSLSNMWRLGYTYTWDRYLDSKFLDYGFVVGYRLGWREIGLTWSRRTNRIGFQILGARVY